MARMTALTMACVIDALGIRLGVSAGTQNSSARISPPNDGFPNVRIRRALTSVLPFRISRPPNPRAQFIGNIGNTNALSTQSALYPAVEQGGLGLSGAGVEDFGRGSAVLNGGARGDLPPISAVGSSAALRAVAASCRDRVLLAWRAFAATTAPRARVGRVVPEDSGPGAAHPSCRSGRGWPEWPPAPRRWPRCVPSRHSARMSPRRCRTPA